jgi:hypothetical protein
MAQEDLIPAKDFCSYHNIEISFIHSLQEYGLLDITTIEESVFIPADRLSELEKMIRLHYELNINMEGIDVINHLQQQIEMMHKEMNAMRNRLKMLDV